ncbi:MAG: PepSY domain-containing protein [Thermoguttaceae bacterium]|nr:PepSY domain-containing protein [Thermoguttaceae bacterium]
MKSIKKACLYLHRYCGWLVGVVFLILCVTGCLLAIQPEIEYWVEPSRFTVPEHSGETMKTAGQLVKTFEKLESESFAEPTTVHVQRLQTSSNPRKTWYALVSARNDKQTWAYIAYVDPYTGKGVSYGPSKANGFFRAVRGWHSSLKIQSLGFLNKPIAWLAGDASGGGRVGVMLVGLFGVLAAFVLLAGFVRWFPKLRNNKNLGNSFRPTFHHGKIRALFDLHSVVGFYATALLLALCLSGSWRAVPWLRACGDKLVGYDASQNAAASTPRGQGNGSRGQGNGSRGQGDGSRGQGDGMRRGGGGPDKEEDTTNYGSGILARRSPGAGGFSPHALAALTANNAFKCEKILETPASLDEIFESQQALTPSSKGFDVILPDAGSDRAITITRYGSFAGFCKPDVYYWDQYTGKNLGKTSFSDLTFGEQFHSLIIPFHTGKIFGALSRWILFLVGLAGVVLTITGYTMTATRLLQKRRRAAEAGKFDDADRKAEESAEKTAEE